MGAPDRNNAKRLFEHHRKYREGIGKEPAMASICLICGSLQVIAKAGDLRQRICCNCGFVFYRYQCPCCGATVDGRDPLNPACRTCGSRICSCGACACAGSGY